MKVKLIVQKIISDKEYEKNAFLYLKNELDRECNKSENMRDYNKVNDLTAAMCELVDGNNEQQDILEIGKQKLYNKISEYNQHKNRTSVTIFRKMLPVLCAAVVVLAANCISVMAWNKNIISAVIEFTQGGFSVDFIGNNREVIELPTSEDDPYGIIAECAKYEIYPETPHYLPDGFELTLTTHNVSDYSNDVKLVYKKDKESITFDVSRYWSEVGQIGIPSDEYNIMETKVNGHTAIISKEDDQYTLVYQMDKTVAYIFTQNVDYSECEKIVASIK